MKMCGVLGGRLQKTASRRRRRDPGKVCAFLCVQPNLHKWCVYLNGLLNSFCEGCNCCCEFSHWDCVSSHRPRIDLTAQLCFLPLRWYLFDPQLLVCSGKASAVKSVASPGSWRLHVQVFDSRGQTNSKPSSHRPITSLLLWGKWKKNQILLSSHCVNGLDPVTWHGMLFKLWSAWPRLLRQTGSVQ